MGDIETKTYTGGFVHADTPIPEYDNHRFIPSVEYFRKYSHLFPSFFTEREIAPACRRWNEQKERGIPDDQRVGLISEKRLVQEVAGRTKDGKINLYKNRKRWQWFVFDIAPQDHPGWTAYHSLLIASRKRTGKHINKKLKELAPLYLERFDEARKEKDHTQFNLKELCAMLGCDSSVVRSWVEIGVDGFGKLPIIRTSDAVKPLRDENGRYKTAKVKAGRLPDYYFATVWVRRFLKGELADPDNIKNFKTIDDITEDTNAMAIANETGYFVYDPNKVYPPTYEGLMAWALKNVVFYDRVTRQKIPFKPNEKQREFYRNAFKMGKDGNFQYKVIGTCRPRGDYKTFDVSLLVAFRFFNMPREHIYLVTNSVQQTTHLIYKELIQIIRNSPTLSTMLDTPALDIQKDGIYLRSGKGIENVFSSIEIVSAEGGARSNATCIAWSEAWKYRGDDVNVAELEQSIRGVDNAWFLVESTVAPKGHFFHNYYLDSLTGENPILYFQYYDGSQRQNPKITAEYINHVKRNWPLHYKMFFDNRWEDAIISLFSEARIIEMGCMGIDGSVGRNATLIETIDKIVEINKEIKKYESGIDVARLIALRNDLMKRLTPLNYKHPAPEIALYQLSEIYNCEFVIGIGIDRAKQMADKSDRTVIATVARGVLDSSKWGTDRIFFLLDLNIMHEASHENILMHIRNMFEKYGGGFGYVDIEDYNAIDIFKTCEDLYGKESAYIAPVSIKHQTLIFDELRMASENGYLKIPEIDIWFDYENKVHYEKPPVNRSDILREELSVFEAHAGTGGQGRNRERWFGAASKKATGRTKMGEPKDDCVYALAHACHAAIRGDISSSAMSSLLVDIYKNQDVVGNYGVAIDRY